MILLDVNVLVAAHREDAPSHTEIRSWLEDRVSSESAFALSDLVLSGFLRVVTHPRVFDPPTPLEEALAFVETLRSLPNGVSVSPGPRHWSIFQRLCHESDATGNLIPDAYLAALAIETGSEWITTDRDFDRFPGLNWTSPHD
jgi:toxin-antitoxin system PIN domain toxin